jgi:hypothetical protein
MTYYALITTKFKRTSEKEPDLVEAGKEVTWIGDQSIPEQPYGVLVTVPRILIDAVKASKVVDEIPPVEIPESDPEDGITLSDTATELVRYTFDPEVLLAFSGTDYVAFLEEYETSGLEAILVRSSAMRPLQILTVDVINLSNDTPAAIYQRIARNLTLTLAGLSEEDLLEVLPILGELLPKYSLPFQFNENNEVMFVI